MMVCRKISHRRHKGYEATLPPHMKNEGGGSNKRPGVAKTVTVE
jgi:hypothetical protein